MSIYDILFISITPITNRKINIGVMILITVMDDTTISVSMKFHDWLKSKGKKEESYEDVIKRMLKPEFVQELESFQGSSDATQ